MSRRTRRQWRGVNDRPLNDFNKYGLPLNQIPARRLERRRAAAKAGRHANRARRTAS